MSQPQQQPHTPRDDDDDDVRQPEVEEEEEEEDDSENPLPQQVEEFVDMAQKAARRHANDPTNILYARRMIFLNISEELRSCMNVFSQCLGGITSAIAIAPYQDLKEVAAHSLKQDVFVAMHHQVELFHRLIETMRNVSIDIAGQERRGHTRDTSATSSIVEFSQPMARAASAVGSEQIRKVEVPNPPRGFSQSKSLQRR